MKGHVHYQRKFIIITITITITTAITLAPQTPLPTHHSLIHSFHFLPRSLLTANMHKNTLQFAERSINSIPSRERRRRRRRCQRTIRHPQRFSDPCPAKRNPSSMPLSGISQGKSISHRHNYFKIPTYFASPSQNPLGSQFRSLQTTFVARPLSHPPPSRSSRTSIENKRPCVVRRRQQRFRMPVSPCWCRRP